MSEEFQYDVFISYSSRDRAWVRGELLKRIEQAGLKAFIDFRDFTRGAPSINEMERGVVECRKTLLILTPDYIASGWGEIENIMLQTLDPANRRLRLIPLLKAECQKPLRIAALTHIDFTAGADLDLAWRQLLTALGAAPELPPPKEPAHPSWRLAHPYPMPPNFTGRVSERGTLTRWLNEDAAHPLLVLRALGGFGKSALTWHWLTHDVDAQRWPHVVWWSFYEGDASFDHFVVEALTYLYGEQAKVQPLSAREALVALLEGLHRTGTLLVLDGFERVLRAFSGLEAAYQGDDVKHTENDRDCVSPLAEHFLYNIALQPQLRSKVLLTTRLCPRILEAKGGGHLAGCREVPLLQMQPEDAVAFFHAQGIRGTHTELELACEPYGYHPLSLRLLAGLVIGDFQQPGDIAAAKRLDVSGDLVQRQHHVLEQAYDSLTPAGRNLLNCIACFRWPTSYDTLKATDSSPETLDRDLRDLIGRGLLHHELQKRRFDLHPIVRHYAYDRFAAPNRAAAHTRLRDYFAAVPKLEKVTSLEDLAPVIELYHHTVRAGQFDEARTLFRDRLHKPLYFQLGAYPLIIDLLRALFPDGEDPSPSSGQAALPRLKDESAQAWTLNALAISYSLSGQSRRAVRLYEQHNAIQKKRERRGDKRNLAIGLGNLAYVAQLPIGALRSAEANLRRSIELS
ncbi:MAG TPA: toll/interleukin-1 receptor domain-containing protein, partial [Chthoniobacteraceae bacterium]|nr:toll/interleukin-1 receptor domain-containing protein [Chthoniobacteraceae bacterium]